MIIVIYQEAEKDSASGAVTYKSLGSESHAGIEEVLLPATPQSKNPIFFTKKFAGHIEYRWEVLDIQSQSTTSHAIYTVTLRRRAQIDKAFYLKNIIAARKQQVRSVLHPWALVEVEFGHSPVVGKSNGNIRGNKRYVDTVQLYSMPKRRLAVVIQIITRSGEDLVQIVPITSQPPVPGEKAAVEVTTELSKMKDYQKRSWAVCRMIQTVTASRIIAPLVKAARTETRDKSFRCSVRGGVVREKLKDALMFGVAADSRVSDTAGFALEKANSLQLTAQVTDLNAQVQELRDRIALYERYTAYKGVTLAEVEKMFQ